MRCLNISLSDINKLNFEAEMCVTNLKKGDNSENVRLNGMKTLKRMVKN